MGGEMGGDNLDEEALAVLVAAVAAARLGGHRRVRVHRVSPAAAGGGPSLWAVAGRMDQAAVRRSFPRLRGAR